MLHPSRVGGAILYQTDGVCALFPPVPRIGDRVLWKRRRASGESCLHWRGCLGQSPPVWGFPIPNAFPGVRIWLLFYHRCSLKLRTTYSVFPQQYSQFQVSFKVGSLLIMLNNLKHVLFRWTF